MGRVHIRPDDDGEGSYSSWAVDIYDGSDRWRGTIRRLALDEADRQARRVRRLIKSKQRRRPGVPV